MFQGSALERGAGLGRLCSAPPAVIGRPTPPVGQLPGLSRRSLTISLGGPMGCCVFCLRRYLCPFLEISNASIKSCEVDFFFTQPSSVGVTPIADDNSKCVRGASGRPNIAAKTLIRLARALSSILLFLSVVVAMCQDIFECCCHVNSKYSTISAIY